MENEVKIADYIQRMIDEKRELDERIAKLVAFRFSEEADETLDREQKGLLDDQFRSMCNYHEILGRRIYVEKVKTGVIVPPSPLSQNSGDCCVAPRY